MQREVAFLAVDEIQLAADHERGHVFTDRLLHARRRGDHVPWLGHHPPDPAAAGARGRGDQPPHASRSSPLPATASCRLPRHSAVVAFSAAEVYSLAEVIRRQKGGAAVVLGALAAHAQHPGRDVPGRRGRASGGHRRHRHGPQHGRGPRRLRPALQVRRLGASPPARAGDGADRRPGRAAHGRSTFGATNGCEPFEPREIEAIENRTFAPLKTLRWRNSGSTLPTSRRCPPVSTGRRSWTAWSRSATRSITAA